MDRREIKNAARFANRVYESFKVPEISIEPIEVNLRCLNRSIKKMGLRTRYWGVLGVESFAWRSFQDLVLCVCV